MTADGRGSGLLTGDTTLGTSTIFMELVTSTDVEIHDDPTGRFDRDSVKCEDSANP